MLSHLERAPRNKERRVAWLLHIQPLFNSVGLVLLAHFRRIFPLFFQWMHADDDETVLLVRASSYSRNVVFSIGGFGSMCSLISSACVYVFLYSMWFVASELAIKLGL